MKELHLAVMQFLLLVNKKKTKKLTCKKLHILLVTHYFLIVISQWLFLYVNLPIFLLYDYITKIQARNQEFFRVDEVSWNKSTTINILSTTHQKKVPQENILDALKIAFQMRHLTDRWT